jgi:DivIVA domain-containing protein
MSPMMETFPVTLRGYDRFEVDRVFAEVDEALASGSETAQAAARETLRNAQFVAVLRGYAIDQVDLAVQDRLRRLGGEDAAPVSFTVVLRGYDMAEVDRLLSQADAALDPGGASLRPAARAALTSAAIRVRLRGYSREQVDREIRRRLHALQQL